MNGAWRLPDTHTESTIHEHIHILIDKLRTNTTYNVGGAMIVEYANDCLLASGCGGGAGGGGRRIRGVRVYGGLVCDYSDQRLAYTPPSFPPFLSFRKCVTD
jgi:hypothetical protein